MRLCDHDILVWLNKGFLSIIPKPSIDYIHGITVDIRLGNKFRTFSEYITPFIDLSVAKDEVKTVLDRVMGDEIELSNDKAFYLHPGELVLAITLESIMLPDNLVGWLDGRSLLARLGLMVHATSHRIDPGWSGHIVLEFFNAGKLPLALRPGMKIGALSFEPLMKSVLYPYNLRKDARYQDQKNITINRSISNNSINFENN